MPSEGQESGTEKDQQVLAQWIIEQNRSTADANRSAVELNESTLKLKLAETPEEREIRLNLQDKQNKIQLKQLEAQSDFQLNNVKVLREFQNDQMRNLQTTFDIMFKQTKGAALMFYVSFWLGVVLVAVSVASYLYFREPDNILTIAFFGAGALAMLSFFLRDPAVKVQQTAGKLVQLQFAMRCHLTEIGYWEIYIGQQKELGIPITFEELEKASKSGWSATQSIMKQIDESLDDLGKNDKGSKDDQKGS
ncbi:MAG: hypothetical protein ABI462_07260 [Ignavibacteria bacterium]